MRSASALTSTSVPFWSQTTRPSGAASISARNGTFQSSPMRRLDRHRVYARENAIKGEVRGHHGTTLAPFGLGTHHFGPSACFHDSDQDAHARSSPRELSILLRSEQRHRSVMQGAAVAKTCMPQGGTDAQFRRQVYSRIHCATLARSRTSFARSARCGAVGAARGML